MDIALERGTMYIRNSSVNINETFTTPSNITNSNTMNPTFDFTNGLISPEIYVQIQYPLKTITIALQIIALILSIINIIVYSRNNMRSTTTLYLIAYNAAIFVLLTVGFVTSVTVEIEHSGLPSRFYLIFGYFIDSFFNTFLHRFMFCLTLLVCMERFVAVAFPLKARHFRVVQSPVTFVLVTFLIFLVVHVYHFLKYEVYLAQVFPNGSEMYSFRNTKMYLEHQVMFLNWALVLRCLLVYAVLLLQVIVNILVVFSLKLHSRQRMKMTTNDDDVKKTRQERQLTVTILVSTFLKILLNLPQATNAAIYDVIPTKYGYFSKERYTFMLSSDIGFACDILSFVTDFLCFIILSSSYRTAMYALLRLPPSRIMRQRVQSHSRQSENTTTFCG